MVHWFFITGWWLMKAEALSPLVIPVLSWILLLIETDALDSETFHGTNQRNSFIFSICKHSSVDWIESLPDRKVLQMSGRCLLW